VPNNGNADLLISIVTVSSSEIIVKNGKKARGKTIQLQAWTGSEGSRSLRLPDFKTIGTLNLILLMWRIW